MIQKQKTEIYEIEDKKYTVITKCVENAEKVDKLYNILCRYAISKLN